MSVSYSEAGLNVRTFSRFRVLTRLRRPHESSSRQSGPAGNRAGPIRARSRKADTVAEEANEAVRLVSIKGPQSAESTRNPSPATKRFWVSYVYPILFYSNVSVMSVTPRVS